MRSGIARASRVVFNAETLIPFLLGSIFLSVLGSAIWQLIANIFGTDTPQVIIIVVISCAIFVFSVLLFGWALGRMKSREFEPHVRSPRKRKGLILLVSNKDVCRKAITYHAPELQCCWLLCSVGERGTKNLADELRQEFPNICQPEPIVINDVNDPQEYSVEVNKIYANLPASLSERDVIADYTGMTAHGSVGIAIACLGADRPLQYTRARYAPDRKPLEPLDPMEIFLTQSEDEGSGTAATAD